MTKHECAVITAYTDVSMLKGDDLKYIEGSIISVSHPRVNMPEMKAGQMQLPSIQNVIDVTYSLDGKNWTDVDAVLQMSFSLDYFTGYRTGLYSFCTAQPGGYADFDYFHQAVY